MKYYGLVLMLSLLLVSCRYQSTLTPLGYDTFGSQVYLSIDNAFAFKVDLTVLSANHEEGKLFLLGTHRNNGLVIRIEGVETLNFKEGDILKKGDGIKMSSRLGLSDWYWALISIRVNSNNLDASRFICSPTFAK